MTTVQLLYRVKNLENLIIEFEGGKFMCEQYRLQHPDKLLTIEAV